VKRGEIWDAKLPRQIKSRPVLILSRDSMPASRPEITVAYLTRKSRYPRVEVALSAAADGVKLDCVVNLDSINTIPKKKLQKRQCTLSAAKMQGVAAAIRVALALP
jgi:mRNA-degrading endonuclease toxin of MazEF toxin-antitoxin module